LAREAFGPSTHVCVLYRSPEEQTSIAAQYLGEGLQRGERCVYVGQSKDALPRLREALDLMEIDADAAVERGALLELTHDEFYLVDGHFDPDRVLAFIESEIIAALDAGYSALRGCGDMSWLMRGARGADQVFAYEARLDELFRGRPVQAMCQYDWKQLPPATIRRALMTHPLSISGH
jgi:hypothetical protein